GDISLVGKLLYDKSSPRPLEALNSEISDTMIESFSSSPIPVKDSDFLMEEIDIFLAVDDSIPPGIDSDGYDSEEDNPFCKIQDLDSTRVLGYEDWRGAVADINEDGFCRDEQTIPDIKLTESRDGDNEGTLQPVDVSAEIVNERPAGIKAKYMMWTPRDWSGDDDVPTVASP
ncbi:reverse transcriptase domain-containing protein, partial [Tanacetum coccineum]